MANYRQMYECGERMQHLWELAARIAIAIHNRVEPLTGQDPNNVNIAYLEAVTHSLRRLSRPMGTGRATKPDFSLRHREALRRRCIIIRNAARLHFEKKSPVRLINRAVGFFSATAGDAWTRDFRLLGFQGSFDDDTAVSDYLRALTPDDYKKGWKLAS